MHIIRVLPWFIVFWYHSILNHVLHGCSICTRNFPNANGTALISTIDSRYIAFMHNKITHTAQQSQRYNVGQICTHERQHISRPHGPVIRCLSWVIQRKWPRYIESALCWWIKKFIHWVLIPQQTKAPQNMLYILWDIYILCCVHSPWLVVY